MSTYVKNEQDEYDADTAILFVYPLINLRLIFWGIVQGKSAEEEMDALKDEYHQRVATLERKVRNYSYY